MCRRWLLNKCLPLTLVLISLVLVFNACATRSPGETLAIETSETQKASPPVILRVDPSTGSISGGNEVTILGSGFQSNSIVEFGHTSDSVIPLNSIVFVSSKQLTGITPAATVAGPVNVYIINPDGQRNVLFAGFQYLNPPPPPAISTVRPNRGPIAGGTYVMIVGAGFQSGCKVVFGDVPLFQVGLISSTELTGITPPNKAGIVDVVIINPDGQTCVLSNAFQYLEPTPVTTTTPTTTTTTTTPTPKVIFSDDFNSETTGANPSKWIAREPNSTDISIDDKVYFGTSGKSAKLQDNSDTERPDIYKVIGIQTGTFWYEAAVRCAQTNQTESLLYISRGEGMAEYGGSVENIAVSLAFWNDGYIKYNDGMWKDIQTYQADKWYTAKVFVDVPNKKYNLYIDGVLKLTDVNFRYSLTSLDRIFVTTLSIPPSSTIWIDNVSITEAP